MSPVFDQFWMTMTFFCVLGPVIFAGFMVALDPPGFRRLLAAFTGAVQRAVSRLRSPWEEPWLPPITAVGPDPKADFALRFVGVTIVAVGVLALVRALP